MKCPYCGYESSDRIVYCCLKSTGQPDSTVSRPKQLPLLIRGIARQRIETDIGVGDTVHRILARMGGSQFEWVMERLGVDCGCGSRQEWLNAVYPYTNAISAKEKHSSKEE